MRWGAQRSNSESTVRQIDRQDKGPAMAAGLKKTKVDY
jgi:hypothetical protein